MPIIDLCVEHWIQEIHDQTVISFENIIDGMRENKTKRRGYRVSTNSDRIALADLAEDLHVTLTSFSFPPKVSPPIPGGGTPTQLEKSEVCSYCNGCGYVEDPCNHLAFFKLCPICKNSSILTVTDVTETVTKETRNIGEKMEQCWGFGMPCATEDDFCPYDEVEECKKRNEIVGVKQ